MEFLFLASKFFAELVLPPAGLLIVAIAALLFLRRWPRAARVALWLAVVSLLALSLPVVATGLNRMLDVPLDKSKWADAQAIVILGGGLKRDTPEYGDTPSTYTMERIRYGAKVAREQHLPILVTGGQVFGGKAEAQVMASTLQQEFGVSPQWIEDRARHTGENARFSAAMLQVDHIDKVILVTHDFHMRRSLEHCVRANLKCAPAPITTIGAKVSWIEQLPNAGALESSATAIHEMLGNLAIAVR